MAREEGTATPKKRRGFAVMKPDAVSAIASKGGKAAHVAGTAHEFSREEARAAGRLGGKATAAKRAAERAAREASDGSPSRDA